MAPVTRHPTSIILDGRDIPVVMRKNRRARRMTLRFQPVKQEVLLTLPWRVSAREGMHFVIEKTTWLAAQARQHRVIPVQHGQMIPLRGELVEVIPTGMLRGTVRLENGKLLVPGSPDHVTRRLHDWLKAQACSEVTVLAHQYAKILGVTITRISLRDTSSRWGSCSADGALSFSWRLILTSPEVLNYVVCHEVAHRREMNHSAAFWHEVAMICPDYNRHRAWLKKHGKGLYRI